MGIKAFATALLLVATTAAAEQRTVYILGPGDAVPHGRTVYGPGDMTRDLHGSFGADLHRPGYLPEIVPSRIRLVIRGGGAFDVFVTPNIVPYRYAVGFAAKATAVHCGGRPGEPVAEIDVAARYSQLELESWGFSGHCR